MTHIHLDHAGGVGDVARAFPNATVYVHPRGTRHLVDPARLVASAATVYGSALDSLYGRMAATPPERVKALEDGEEIGIGHGRTLTTVHSPGHAKHHLALHDSATGVLFVGDAVGVRLPDAGILRPATPPADFDLDQALDSLSRFSQRSPSALALAHYGLLGEPSAVLEEAAGALQEWADVARTAWRCRERRGGSAPPTFRRRTGGARTRAGPAGRGAQRLAQQRRGPQALAFQGRPQRLGAGRAGATLLERSMEEGMGMAPYGVGVVDQQDGPPFVEGRAGV